MKKPSVPWKVWLGLAVSLVSLVWVFYGVPFDELLAQLQQVSFVYLILGIFFFTIYLVIIARRWQIVLTPLEKPALIDTFSPIMIGRLVDNLLPLRAGEVIKLVLISRKLQVSKSAVLATVVIDRLLDILSLLSFVVILLFVMDIPVVVKQSLLLFTVVAMPGFILLWFLGRSYGSFESMPLVQRIIAMIPQRIQELISNTAISFVTGLQSLQTTGSLLQLLFFSTLSWLFVAVSVSFFLKAVNLELPWYAPLFLLVVTNFGALIPASPGALGVFHALVIYTLSLWSVEKDVALTMAIIYHESLYILVTLLGLFFLWREGYSLVALRQLQEQPDLSHS